MMLKHLVGFLDANGVRDINITHSTAFTAWDVAESVHISGTETAKTVIVLMESWTWSPCRPPPFGNLYNMKIFVDELLAEDKEFAFNAGSHHELIRMNYRSTTDW
jgi:Ala-tRNA(Pro) deacylase